MVHLYIHLYSGGKMKTACSSDVNRILIYIFYYRILIRNKEDHAELTRLLGLWFVVLIIVVVLQTFGRLILEGCRMFA